MPECQIGLFPDVGCTHALTRLPKGPAFGLYAAYQGERHSAVDCMIGGFATHFLASRKIPELKKILSETNKQLSKAEINDIIVKLGENGKDYRDYAKDKVTMFSMFEEEIKRGYVVGPDAWSGYDGIGVFNHYFEAVKRKEKESARNCMRWIRKRRET